jgi:Tol biopolymer transport system component
LIAFAESGEKAALDIWPVPVGGDRKPYPYLQSRFATYWAQISPDSRWMAYGSDQSPHPQQVFVASIPAGKGSWQISTEGGDWAGSAPDRSFRDASRSLPKRAGDATLQRGLLTRRDQADIASGE